MGKTREWVRFDPNKGTVEEQRERARHILGWWGLFPTTPCRNCDVHWFERVGDRGMGYRCVECNEVWNG